MKDILIGIGCLAVLFIFYGAVWIIAHGIFLGKDPKKWDEFYKRQAHDDVSYLE